MPHNYLTEGTMKELHWSKDMAIEEKIEAGFKEVLRRFDIQGQEINELRQLMNRRFFEVDQRFEKMDARFDRMDARFDRMDLKMDGVLRVLHCHDEDFAVLQKAVGQK